jgi:hypothetical protein
VALITPCPPGVFYTPSTKRREVNDFGYGFVVWDRKSASTVGGVFQASQDAQKHADRLAAKDSRTKAESHSRDILTVTV